MNYPKSSSLLLSCCIAVVLLFSLWTVGAQDLAQHDVHSEIAVAFDMDTHADDPVEQPGVLSRHMLSVFASAIFSYHKMLAQPVLSNSAPPPDRPPIESV